MNDDRYRKMVPVVVTVLSDLLTIFALILLALLCWIAS